MEPRYRTTATVFVNGTQWGAGGEFSFRGWPKADMHLQPINEAAKKISDYYDRRKYEPSLPPSPVDARTGKIFLPGMLPYLRSRNFPPAMSAIDAPAGMPIYVALWDAEFGGKLIKQGEKFGFGGWPELAMNIKPANAAAKRVMAFLEKYDPEKCPNLPVSPYNFFDGSLWLPEPPEPVPDDNQPVHRAPPRLSPPPIATTAESHPRVISDVAIAAIRRDADRKPFAGAALGPRER